MDELIERDAITNTPDAPTDAHEHVHEEIKTFVATPRQDEGFIERVVKWFKGEALKPGMHIVREKSDGLRLMTIITSNSYEDREKETITSKALQAYEDSCYPGEGLYHNDNPLLWWHDDDIVMGEIIAVNYSEPFLLEVARELPNPVSKTLFDYAEQNGDQAGASHRFGYLEGDRDDDGTYHRIFKQETSYLPKRALAANDKTYAGVVNMASPQSDALIDKIFEPIGIKNASSKFHAKTGEIEKEFAALGLVHKALPPTPPTKKPPMTPQQDAQALEADAAASEDMAASDDMMAADMQEDAMEAEAEARTMGTMDDLKKITVVLDTIYGMMQSIIDNAAASELDRVEMFKSFNELKDLRMSEKAADKATLDALLEKFKALEKRQDDVEKQVRMTPRSVTHQKGGTADEAKVAIDNAEKSRIDGDLQDVPGWGKLKPLPK